ncbi:unnamed protein product [Camellia sinensis]
MELVPVRKNFKSVFADDGPSFYKIIKGSASVELKLSISIFSSFLCNHYLQEIPPHFMNHLVNEAADKATLKSPSGDLWTVVLRKKENGTYLQDGWSDFVRNHKVVKDEFLIFRYDGNLHFSVQIYDVNGLERASASFTRKHQGADTSKQGTSAENEIDSLHLHQLKDSELINPEPTRKRKRGGWRKKVDPINLHQSKSFNCAPKAAPNKKRRCGRPRKNEATDALVLRKLERCKRAPEAASNEKRRPGRPRKNEAIGGTLNLCQPEPWKHAPKAASNEKRRPGRPRKNEAIGGTPILCQPAPWKHAPKAASNEKRSPGRPRKNEAVDTLILHKSESCKRASKAASAETRTSGRLRKNEANGTLTFCQPEPWKCAPKAASNEKRRPGRPRKNKAVEVLNLHKSESCKCASEAASTEKRTSGSLRKNKANDTLILRQPEPCKQTFEAASSRKRKCGRPIKKDDPRHQSKSCKYAQGVKKFKKIKRTERKVKEKEMDPTIMESDRQSKVNEEDKDNKERKKKRCKIHKEHHLRNIKHTKKKIKEKKVYPTIKEADSQLEVNEEEEVNSKRKKRKSETHEKHHSRKVKHTKSNIKGQEIEPTREADSQLKMNEEEKDNSKRKKRKCEKQEQQHSQTMRPPTEEERARVLEKADSFVSKFPCYKRCLQYYDVHKMFFLPIDKPFSVVHFPLDKSHIVLWDSKGKDWNVTVLFINGRHKFSEGWRSFVLANQLKEGDVCIFELIKEKEMLVHVF